MPQDARTYAVRYGALLLLTLPLVAAAPDSAKAQATQTFYNPMINGMRVDRCLTWATNCDEPAASVFCRGRSYSRAIAWQWEYTSPTLVQGDGQICNIPGGCGGFSQITCVP